ncbi:MAG: LysR family transcriptional regulator [Myxococcales bacterium]|nr:LysR family transcriptional regulator [Myxococcales bacterium]
MDPKELAGQDLNLLVALHALLQERHVSRAATVIGRSQPAMSRALTRLRDMFADPLLVRVGAEMQATARAQELHPEVEAVLRSIRGLLQPVEFDPRSATGVLRLSAPDLVTYMLVPPLMRALGEQAPELDVEIVHWSPDWREQLEQGVIDLTVGMPVGDEPNLYTRPLIESHWACLLRGDHPALEQEWTVEVFAALDHLEVTLAGRLGGNIDAALGERGLRRRVALRVPYPVLSPLLIAESDLVLTTNRWVARTFSGLAGLAIRPLPIPAPPLRAPMVWHERSHRDPANCWLRGLLAELVRDIDMRELAPDDQVEAGVET